MQNLMQEHEEKENNAYFEVTEVLLNIVLDSLTALIASRT